VLFQHRCNGDRSVEVARGKVHGEAGDVDAYTEAEPDLRARVAAAISSSLRRRRGASRAPVEPARPRRRQSRRSLPRLASRSGEPPPLERQGETVAANRFEEALSVG